MRKLANRLITLLVVAAIGAASPVLAQEWPTKPIRIVLPFAAGGINDVIVRAVADKVGARLGQTIVVEAKTGASGVIGADAVAKSQPDGYTWLASSFPLTVAPALLASLPFDPVKDLRAVAMIATAPNVLVVSSSLPIDTVQELVARAKASPNALMYASPGAGSSAHIGTDVFARAAGFSATHVLYRGAPPALVDVMAGRVTFMLVSGGLAVPHVKSGRLRALAVMDSQRSGLLPDVPSIVEAGYARAPVVPWFAIHVPSGTPDRIVERIHAELEHALNDTDVHVKLEKAGVRVSQPGKPQAIDARMREEVARWKDLAREIDLPKQ